MGALGDVARDFVEMKLHRLGVGMGQGERRANAAGSADRSEQIGVFVALIGGLARPRSPLRPLSDPAVFLADAGFILGWWRSVGGAEPKQGLRSSKPLRL